MAVVRCRPAEYLTLDFGAALLADALELFLSLDALGDSGDAEPLTEVRDGPDHGGAVWAMGGIAVATIQCGCTRVRSSSSPIRRRGRKVVCVDSQAGSDQSYFVISDLAALVAAGLREV